jgi:RimJ/RimL family protein N-acetyltransferase
MLKFVKINFQAHMKECVRFREDSFKASFPESDEWKRYWNEAEYRAWIVGYAKQYPNGVLHIWREEDLIGQLEFSYTVKTGHINLYYLRPGYRGRGYGVIAHAHVVRTLLNHGCKTATLRVSPTNTRAIAFYKNIGWMDLGQDPKYSHVHKFTIDLQSATLGKT